mmetsp:Transcript_44911/g.106783  ORF Transcript_44911/g.106783 Transcript_44911/m.106783 type:complete len:203 (+) Transcript_44911:163-771(+)
MVRVRRVQLFRALLPRKLLRGLGHLHVAGLRVHLRGAALRGHRHRGHRGHLRPQGLHLPLDLWDADRHRGPRSGPQLRQWTSCRHHRLSAAGVLEVLAGHLHRRRDRGGVHLHHRGGAEELPGAVHGLDRHHLQRGLLSRAAGLLLGAGAPRGGNDAGVGLAPTLPHRRHPRPHRDSGAAVHAGVERVSGGASRGSGLGAGS